MSHPKIGPRARDHASPPRRLPLAGRARRITLSPLSAGLAFLPVTVLIMASDLMAGRAISMLGTRRVAASGAVLVGLECLAMFGLLSAHVAALVPALVAAADRQRPRRRPVRLAAGWHGRHRRPPHSIRDRHRPYYRGRSAKLHRSIEPGFSWPTFTKACFLCSGSDCGVDPIARPNGQRSGLVIWSAGS